MRSIRLSKAYYECHCWTMNMRPKMSLEEGRITICPGTVLQKMCGKYREGYVKILVFGINPDDSGEFRQSNTWVIDKKTTDFGLNHIYHENAI
jgi:hypothetical protein